MTKNELIKAIAKRLEVSQEQARKHLQATLSVIKDTIKNKENVVITDFGKFYISERKQRKGINPITKKAITLPAFSLPAFKVSETFKNYVNEKKAEKKQKLSASAKAKTLKK